ncbi:MAG: hypothetical protein Q4D81_00620 [Eubacteriales bacterium]|nr:hypothetical protein [Eubacteriales bacterium]
MLDERKIRLMTRMTVYEKGRGIGDDRMAKYFRNDYVFAGIVGSFVTGTLAWGICAAVYCGYYFEQLFFSVYEDTLAPVLRLAVTSYAAFMGFFLLISLLVYRRRSIAYRNRRMMYEQDLDELMEIY